MKTFKKKTQKANSLKDAERFFSSIRVTVDQNMKDHSDAPLFVKKAKEAEEDLKMWGLPPGL